MGKIRSGDLPPVAVTLLVPLACRARENQRTDAILRDERAVKLLQQFDEELSRLGDTNDMEQVCILLRARRFDHYAQTFLARYPDAVIVEIGCGFDTRFHRLDNGRLTWYGMDLPEVIAIRRRLLPEGKRNRLIACSVMDLTWMDTIPRKTPRPTIFLAEGVFPYFKPDDVRRLILALRAHFPVSEVVFDGLSSLSISMHQLTTPVLKVTDTRLQWAINNGRELESWGEGIHLLDEWFYYDNDEPRMRWFNLMRYFPPLGKANRVLHYRLGDEE